MNIIAELTPSGIGMIALFVTVFIIGLTCLILGAPNRNRYTNSEGITDSLVMDVLCKESEKENGIRPKEVVKIIKKQYPYLSVDQIEKIVGRCLEEATHPENGFLVNHIGDVYTARCS